MRQKVSSSIVKSVVLSLTLFTLPSLTLLPSSEAVAQTSSRTKSKSTAGSRTNAKPRGARTRTQPRTRKAPVPTAQTQVVERVSDTTRETALRKIAVTPFLIQKTLSSEVSAQQAKSLAAQIATDLSAKSYLQAEVLEGNGLTKAGREELLRQMNSSEIDGVLIGSLSPTGANLYLLSKSGERLVSADVSMRLRLVKPETLKTLGEEIVDEVVRNVPYRGFLTKETEDGVYELNLGSEHGVTKGQKFRVFDFEKTDLKSSRNDRGEVEVLEVRPTTSVVGATSNARNLKPYMKIGFDERARGMVVESQTPMRGFGMIGGQMITVSGSSDPQYIDRSYNMKGTPGLALGLGWNKTSVRALLAQAQNEDVDLVYMEVIGLYRLWEKTSGFNTYSFSAGGRYARFGVTVRRTLTTPLESSSSLAPVFAGRWEHMIGGPVHVFLGGDLFYPMFNSGNGAASSLAFAYGAGGELGTVVDLSQRLSLEFGAKLHFIRRPIEGQSAVQERYTQLFADLIARF